MPRALLIRWLSGVVASAMLLAGCAGSGVIQQGSQPGATSGDRSSQSIGNQGEQGAAVTHYAGLDLTYADPGIIEKDRSTWALPTDRYFDDRSFNLELLAIELLNLECMHSAGFTEESLGRDFSAPKAVTEGSGGTRLFTVEIAQQYGYRMALDPRNVFDYGPDTPGGDWLDNRSDEYANAWERCRSEAIDEVNGWKDEIWEAEEQAFWEEHHPGEAFPTDTEGREAWFWELNDIWDQQAAEAAEDPANLNRWHIDTSTPELQESAAQWRQCMAPLGIVDLPLEPWDTDVRPPESLQERWGWISPLESPSADEIEVATFDARCREAADWFDLFYEESWKQATVFVEQYGERLDAQYLPYERRQAEEAIRVIREYIARQG